MASHDGCVGPCGHRGSDDPGSALGLVYRTTTSPTHCCKFCRYTCRRVCNDHTELAFLTAPIVSPFQVGIKAYASGPGNNVTLRASLSISSFICNMPIPYTQTPIFSGTRRLQAPPILFANRGYTTHQSTAGGRTNSHPRKSTPPEALRRCSPWGLVRQSVRATPRRFETVEGSQSSSLSYPLQLQRGGLR